MKLAFIVHRTNYLKFYGSLINEALARGDRVQLWLYSVPQAGKGYLQPKLENLPKFRGYVEAMEFQVVNNVYSQLVEAKVEVAFSLHPRSHYTSETNNKLVFVTLQHGIDSFLEADPVGLASSDLLFLYAPFWVDWAADYYQAELGLKAAETKKQLAQVVHFAGFPQMDVVDLVDRQSLRAKYGIPAGNKVILLLPITLANKRGAWPRFFEAPNRLAQFVQLVKGAQKEGWEFARQLWKWVVWGWNDRSLTKAVARFAKANDAFLIVKGREKDPVRPWTAKAADHVIYDEDLFPPTILDILSIADLCIQFYSFAALEAVFCGVPSLTVDRPSPSAGFLEAAPLYHVLWRRKDEGSAFNYPGAVQWATIPEVIKNLPKQQLQHFSMDPAARETYLNTYMVHPKHGSSAAQVLDTTIRYLNERS